MPALNCRLSSPDLVEARAFGDAVVPSTQKGSGVTFPHATIRFIAAWVAAAALCWAFSSASAAEKVALVVGAYDYAGDGGGGLDPLVNPKQDAAGMATTLEALGFELVGGGPLENPDLQTLQRAVVELRNAAEEDGLALFYFAGHAVEISGENYLVPIGARLDVEDDKDVELLPLQFVLDRLRSAESEKNVVILDACRDNPFAPSARGAQAVGGGLASVRSIPSMFIAYATEPSAVALDGPAGGNSPYTRALLDKLSLPGLPIFIVFDYVSRQVAEETEGFQVPFQIYNYGVSDLVLNRPSDSAAAGEAYAQVDFATPTTTRTRSAGDRPRPSPGGAPPPPDPQREARREARRIASGFIRAFHPFRSEPTPITIGSYSGYQFGYGRTSIQRPAAPVVRLNEERWLGDILGELDALIDKEFGGLLDPRKRAAVLSYLYAAKLLFDLRAPQGDFEAVAPRFQLVRELSGPGAKQLSDEAIAGLFTRPPSYLKGSGPGFDDGVSGPDQEHRRALEASLYLDGAPTTTAEIETLRMIMRFEEGRLDAYRDIAGNWEIGYGDTARAKEGLRITRLEAVRFLVPEVRKFSSGVSSLVEVEIDAFQEAALTSLAYNIGLDAFERSTALRRLNDGDIVGAAEALRWWNKAGGKVIAGLAQRREAEAALFLRNVDPAEIAEYYAKLAAAPSGPAAPN